MPDIRRMVAEHESAHVVVAAAVGIGCWWADARSHDPHVMLATDDASPFDHAVALAGGWTWEHLRGWRAGPCRGTDRAEMRHLVPMYLVREVTTRACSILAARGDEVLSLTAELARAGGVLDAAELQAWWDQVQPVNTPIDSQGQIVIMDSAPVRRRERSSTLVEQHEWARADDDDHGPWRD